MSRHLCRKKLRQNVHKKDQSEQRAQLWEIVSGTWQEGQMIRRMRSVSEERRWCPRGWATGGK